MALNVFSNNGEGALNASIGTGDTVFSLEAGDGASMPPIGAGEQFPIVVIEGTKYEWMMCTARSGDQLTVTRDPTSPQSFSAGARVDHRMSGDVLNTFMQKGAERTVTTDPDGVLAASYFGEEVLNTITGRWWKHTTGTTWQEMNYRP
jgi:hypothetical protein